MNHRAQLVGHKFGRLTVARLIEVTRSGSLWDCVCDCGGRATRLTTNLKKVRDGGCKQCETERRAAVHVTHGGSKGGKSKLFMIWKGMHSRCRDPGNTSFSYYGGKGIRVSAEWATFEPFRDWAIANGYEPGLSIDRATSSCDYGPRHCEWVTRSENSKRLRTGRQMALLAEALLAA